MAPLLPLLFLLTIIISSIHIVATVHIKPALSTAVNAAAARRMLASWRRRLNISRQANTITLGSVVRSNYFVFSAGACDLENNWRTGFRIEYILGGGGGALANNAPRHFPPAVALQSRSPNQSTFPKLSRLLQIQPPDVPPPPPLAIHQPHYNLA